MNFSATICSIGWPGDAPGFAAVLELRNHKIYLRHEIEEEKLDKLLKACLDLKRKYDLRGFVGRNDKQVMQFIQQFNCDEMQPYFEFYTAPNIVETGRFYYHLSLLKSCLELDHKNLFLFDGCKLQSYLQGLPATGIQEICDIQHPALAALAYGVACIKDAEIDYT